jgi:hypothetical protein
VGARLGALGWLRGHLGRESLLRARGGSQVETVGGELDAALLTRQRDRLNALCVRVRRDTLAEHGESPDSREQFRRRSLLVFEECCRVSVS